MVSEKDSIQLLGEVKTEGDVVYVDFSDKQIIEASKQTSYYKNLVETIENLQENKQVLEKQLMYTSGYAFSLIVVLVLVVSVDHWWNSVLEGLREKGVKSKHKPIVIWKRVLMYVGFMSFTMLLDFFFMVYANLLSPYFMLVFISAFIGTKLYRFFLIQKLRGEDMSDFKKRFVKKVEHKVDDLLSGGVGTENYGSPYGGVSDYTGEDGADDNTNNNS